MKAPPACLSIRRGAPATSPPPTTITGNNTGLSGPEGITLDSSLNIYVADANAASVFVYSAGSTGNVPPIATISGPATGLSAPYGIGLDSRSKIYVADAFVPSRVCLSFPASLQSSPVTPTWRPSSPSAGARPA